MDARLTPEQQQLREAATQLAGDLGARSVLDLSDLDRIARLEKAVEATGWRQLRSDGASGVEVAAVAEEFARGLVDVPFLGPTLADDLMRRVGAAGRYTIVVDNEATDALGYSHGLSVQKTSVSSSEIGNHHATVDLTRTNADVTGALVYVGDVSARDVQRWEALAIVITAAELVGSAKGAQALACDYAKIRKQYGNAIGTYQAVAHLLAEGQALIEGSISVLRHAAWGVDQLPETEAVRAAMIAKMYCARAARTVCENAIQVHGGIGNTWECLVHAYLRRVLTANELFPVTLEEISHGLS